MSKSRLPSSSDDIYPIHTDVVEAFLGQNGFQATGSEMLPPDHVWKKDDIILKIVRDKVFTKTQVEEILDKARLKIEDFEHYIERIKVDGVFDKLIDWSLKTPPLKHLKKGGNDPVK